MSTIYTNSRSKMISRRRGLRPRGVQISTLSDRRRANEERALIWNWNYSIGLEIHKKVIAYCIKRIDGELVRQGIVAAERKALMRWLWES